MPRYLKIILFYVGAIFGAVAIFAAGAYFGAWFKVSLKFLPLPGTRNPRQPLKPSGATTICPEGLQ